MVVRRAAPADAPTLAHLIATAFAQYRDTLVPPSGALHETPRGISDELGQPGHLAFIAVEDAVAAGCVLCKPEDGDLYFGRLSVLPSMRGRGIAQRLIEAVEAHAHAQRFPAVLLSVRIALPENRLLFARYGYVEISRHAHDGFDHPTFIRMRKVLAPSREFSDSA
jgi:ribosomal protein S18 acetylase RimI-like enzyme